MDKLSSRMDRTEERHGKPGDKTVGIIQTEHGEKIFWEKTLQSLRDLLDYNKRSNVHVIRVLE